MVRRTADGFTRFLIVSHQYIAHILLVFEGVRYVYEGSAPHQWFVCEQRLLTRFGILHITIRSNAVIHCATPFITGRRLSHEAKVNAASFRGPRWHRVLSRPVLIDFPHSQRQRSSVYLQGFVGHSCPFPKG